MGIERDENDEGRPRDTTDDPARPIVSTDDHERLDRGSPVAETRLGDREVPILADDRADEAEPVGFPFIDPDGGDEEDDGDVGLERDWITTLYVWTVLDHERRRAAVLRDLGYPPDDGSGLTRPWDDQPSDAGGGGGGGGAPRPGSPAGGRFTDDASAPRAMAPGDREAFWRVGSRHRPSAWFLPTELFGRPLSLSGVPFALTTFTVRAGWDPSAAGAASIPRQRGSGFGTEARERAVSALVKGALSVEPPPVILDPPGRTGLYAWDGTARGAVQFVLAPPAALGRFRHAPDLTAHGRRGRFRGSRGGTGVKLALLTGFRTAPGGPPRLDPTALLTGGTPLAHRRHRHDPHGHLPGFPARPAVDRSPAARRRPGRPSPDVPPLPGVGGARLAVDDVAVALARAGADPRRGTAPRVVRLAGTIDADHASRARAELSDAIGGRGAPVALVIDLRDVTAVDAVGWRVLAWASARVASRGGSLLLAGANPRVRQSHRVGRVDQPSPGRPPIPLYESVEDAVRAAERAGPGPRGGRPGRQRPSRGLAT